MIDCPNCGQSFHGPRQQCPACGIEAGELTAVADGGQRDNGNNQREPGGNQPHRGGGQNPQSGRAQQGGGRGGGHRPRGQQGQPPQGGQQPPNQGQQGQPPQGQGRGGRQAHQGAPPQGGPPRGGPQRGGDDDSGLTDNLTRRQLLIGGGGAAVLAAGGGYWFLSRGPGGAKGIVDSYYGNVDSFDEEGVLAQFHPDSPTYDNIDQNGLGAHLGRDQNYYDNVNISVVGLHRMNHETNPEDSFRTPFNPDEVNASEYKEILAIVEHDASGWEQAEQQAEDEDDLTFRSASRHTVVNDDEGWKLWN